MSSKNAIKFSNENSYWEKSASSINRNIAGSHPWYGKKRRGRRKTRLGIEILLVVSYHLHTIFYGGGPSCGTQKKSIRLSSKNSYRESFRNTPKSASLRNGGNHLFPYFVPILGKKKRLWGFRGKGGDLTTRTKETCCRVSDARWRPYIGVGEHTLTWSESERNWSETGSIFGIYQ